MVIGDDGDNYEVCVDVDDDAGGDLDDDDDAGDDLDDDDDDAGGDLDEAQMVYLVQPLAARAPHYTRSAFPGPLDHHHPHHANYDDYNASDAGDDDIKWRSVYLSVTKKALKPKPNCT